MNRLNREIGIEMLVGLFMFAALIILGVFTIVLSRENVFGNAYSYEFVFSEVGGLREGDSVYLRGINVGRVKQTTLENSRVHVYITLDVPITLREGYSIDVVEASMLGGKHLKIYEGPEKNSELGEKITILGNPPVNMIEKLAVSINGLQSIISAVEKGRGTLGKLLIDDTIYNNMMELSDGLKTIVKRIEQGKGTVGKLLNDDSVYEEAKVLMANLRGISDRLAAGEGLLGRLMSEDEDSAVYDDIGAATAAVRDIAESIRSGEGTLGKLLCDPELYDEITALVEDARAAIDDVREASPIASFGSFLFGAF